MSEYLVTARKWRPMVFEDVVGQSHVTTTLRNALSSGRLAHAYLFSGARGVGKTTTARLLAKAVNCRTPRDLNPDNECDNCLEITEGRSFDVLEIDGASNRGVEEIRNLRESVKYSPAKGKYRVYIIDEVHMLTKEAFNALLKTLEEPPSHVLFIFATTEIHKVPATILSRCQRFDFRRIPVEEIRGNLASIAKAEGIAMDDDAMMLVARRGDGSLRDAQSIFDQVVALCGQSVTYAQIIEALHIVDQELYFRVTDLVRARDAAGALSLVEDLFSRGYDTREFLAGLIEHFRNLLIAKTTGTTALIEASDQYRKRYAQEAERFSVTDLLRFQRFITGTESGIRWASQPRFRLEADMVQLVTLPGAAEVSDLLASLDTWKKKEVAERPAPAEAPGPAGPAPAARESAPRTASPQLSAQEVQSRWAEYLAEVRKRRISLGSVLESTRLIQVDGVAVKIGCPGDFEVSSIMRNRETLSEIFAALFQVRPRLEPVLDAALRHEAVTPPPENDHPIVAALKRELGAEPV